MPVDLEGFVVASSENLDVKPELTQGVVSDNENSTELMYPDPGCDQCQAERVA
jgi:hypothetical protein